MKRPQTAMILAAGRGERMRPLTDHTPKPLLEVQGKPMIVSLLEKLSAAGVTHVVINHAHLGEQIVKTLGDGAAWGVTISYSSEQEALETAGGIIQALPLLNDELFWVVNGDLWTDFDFSVSPLLAENQLAHLFVVSNPEHNPRGDFALERGLLCAEGAPRYTFSGIGLYRRALFQGLSTGRRPLAPLLRDAMAQQQVAGTLYQGLWCDVGTPARLAQLNQRKE